MSEVSHRVAEMLLSTESIQVYKDKPFVFVSGRISPVYIDCRKLLSFAPEREYIVTALAKVAEADIGLVTRLDDSRVGADGRSRRGDSIDAHRMCRVGCRCVVRAGTATHSTTDLRTRRATGSEPLLTVRAI